MNRQHASAESARLVRIRLSFRGIIVETLICLSMIVPLNASPPPSVAEPDDRLSREHARLVDDLIRKNKPALVETLLTDSLPAHRVYVARAYAKAAIEANSPAIRERFLDKSAVTYRGVIALGDDTSWMRGEKRQFNVAQWQVEFADLILRYQIAPDLDWFEITSGLDFNRERLQQRLTEAYNLFNDAFSKIDAMALDLASDEERYLLYGIADEIRNTHKRCRLSRAWAGLYLGMVSGDTTVNRTDLLTEALNSFDTQARISQDAEQKYSALVGAGIALRELARYPEAMAAFDRVLYSTAPVSLIVRARYEKARSLLSSGDFPNARGQLDNLISTAHRYTHSEEMGCDFFVQMAPLLRAYSYLCEARLPGNTQEQKAQLEHRALSAFTSLTKNGKASAAMIQPYLSTITGTTRDFDQLDNNELRLAVEGLMTQNRHSEARKGLHQFLTRALDESLRNWALFNLGVCCFQMEEYPAAAEAFTRSTDSGAVDDLARRATEYAYKCRRQIAHASAKNEDYRLLAEAASRLVERFPQHPLAQEAAWIGALATQETGDYEAAVLAYARIRSDAPHYWDARRNTARCKQAMFEALPRDTLLVRKHRVARGAASAWVSLANDLSVVRDDNVFPPLPSDALRRIEAARSAAASIFAHEDIRAYKESLTLLRDVPPTGRVLGLRVRCHRGLGDMATANAVLEEYLARFSGEDVGTTLIGLAAEMEEDVVRLNNAHRTVEAKRAATEAIPTLQHLLGWITARTNHAKHVHVVRFSLTRMLSWAGQHDEAASHLDILIAESPKNGEYIRTAALLHEERGETMKTAQKRADAQDRAEALWEKLLTDKSLRMKAPDEYWQARYHWLNHQLRHGKAVEVVKGIETEKAWYPELGGPEWSRRLLDLAERARNIAESQSP